MSEKPKLTLKLKNIISDSEESDSESDYESADEYDEELTPEERKNKAIEYLGLPKDSTDSYDLHSPDYKTFLEVANPYCYNQSIDKNHVKQIMKQYIKNSDNVEGMFICIIDEYGKIYLLDGHHRYAALQKAYNKKGDNLTVKMYVKVYYIDTIDGPESRELFNRINNVKPFRNDKNITRHIHNIITKLKDRYDNRIRDKPSKVPNIQISTINNAFREKFRNITNINEDQIFNDIKQKNNKLKTQTYDDIKKLNKNITQTQYNRMKNYNFFLSVLSPDKWF